MEDSTEETLARVNEIASALDVYRQRAAEVAAAWDVWSEAQHAIRLLVRRNEWAGDLPEAGQRQALKEQFNGQIFEAYARARVQCAIVLAVDGVDQLADYREHWEETWGAAIVTRAEAVYAERIAAARERQQKARSSAATQSAALVEAAGVTT